MCGNRLRKSENLVGYSILTIPETTKSLSALRHRAARALLLVVSKGSNLKFNPQKSQGTWPEEMAFSSQVLSDRRNCFFLQVLPHFLTLTTLFKSCPHNNITPNTSIFSAGTKKETHSHLAVDEHWKQNCSHIPHLFFILKELSSMHNLQGLCKKKKKAKGSEVWIYEEWVNKFNSISLQAWVRQQ